MAGSLPPELVAPGDREARVASLKRQIGREWISYVIVEWIVIGLPGLVLLVVWQATDAVSDTAATAVLVALVVASCALFGYWSLRTRPLSREVDELEAFETAP